MISCVCTGLYSVGLVECEVAELGTQVLAMNVVGISQLDLVSAFVARRCVAPIELTCCLVYAPNCNYQAVENDAILGRPR
jgi:hypothetical protein